MEDCRTDRHWLPSELRRCFSRKGKGRMERKKRRQKREEWDCQKGF